MFRRIECLFLQRSEPKPKPVLLHVEDDDTTAHAFRIALREQNANVEVFRLCNGEDAMLFLNGTGVFAGAPRLDVIVLDLNLPKKNGREIIAEIRQEADLRHVPVIMLNSSLRPEDRDKALLMGAAGFLHKPVNVAGFCGHRGPSS